MTQGRPSNLEEGCVAPTAKCAHLLFVGRHTINSSYTSRLLGGSGTRNDVASTIDEGGLVAREARTE